MPRSLRISLYVLASLAGLIVLVALLFQWNWLKAPIEARLGRATGKQVKIVGDVHGEWHWHPRIVFDDVQISEPDWQGNGTKVGQIEHTEIVVSVPALFRGALELPEIKLIKPELALVRHADGSANWTLDLPDDNSGSGPKIGNLQIEHGKLALQDALKKIGIESQVQTVNDKDGNGRIRITGHGTYKDAKFELKFEGGSVLNLRDTTQPYKVNVDAVAGRTHLTAVGTVIDPVQMAGLNLLTTLEGENAADLFPIAGIAAPDTPPYKLTGTLLRKGKIFTFQKFDGTVGDSDLQGTLQFDAGRERMLISGNLHSKQLKLKDLGLVVGAPAGTTSRRGTNTEQRVVAERFRNSDRVLPDAPLDFARIRSVDADVTLKAQTLEAPGLPLEDLDLGIKLDNSLLGLKPLKVGVAGGRAEGGIVIDARQDRVKTEYDLRLRGFKFEEILRRAGVPGHGDGTINGRIQLVGTGNSIRRSLGNADGQISAVMEGGRLSSLATELVGLDIAEAIGFAITGDKTYPMRCAVADFNVRDGIMDPRALVIDTTDTLIVGQGDISLRREALDLRIEANPKDVSPLTVRTPITIGGTFKYPAIGVDPKPLLIKGGIAAVLSVVLTPVGAALAFVDPGEGAQDSDCRGMINEANTRMTPAAQDATKQATPKPQGSPRTGTGSSTPVKPDKHSQPRH
ncbi:AsmA family protein [Roseiterribacter gracilis]|uniref:Membrane protein n=1 Tax=Roseiterribacter gracilis TaxID=2812848 RepID=A0A8S8XBQ4_9PROT|nr:membrane protein [Rhodospirillales bacterium TMPK1]